MNHNTSHQSSRKRRGVAAGSRQTFTHWFTKQSLRLKQKKNHPSHPSLDIAKLWPHLQSGDRRQINNNNKKNNKKNLLFHSDKLRDTQKQQKPKWNVNLNHRDKKRGLCEHLQEWERGRKHTWFWLKLLEIGLKTPSNSLSGFCHNNNNQLTPMRPQISLKLIFRLFFTSRKSQYWRWSPLRGFCWTHSPLREEEGAPLQLQLQRRNKVLSLTQAQPVGTVLVFLAGFYWVVIVEGDNLGKINLLVRLRKQLWPHRVFPLSGIMFHHWEYWTLQPSNIRTSACSHSALFKKQ